MKCAGRRYCGKGTRGAASQEGHVRGLPLKDRELDLPGAEGDPGREKSERRRHLRRIIEPIGPGLF